jgi:hypothetical protein
MCPQYTTNNNNNVPGKCRTINNQLKDQNSMEQKAILRTLIQLDA